MYQKSIGRIALSALAAGLAGVSAASGQSDDCAAATAITDGIYSGSTIAAGNDGSACAESTTSADVWYRYTAAGACALHINLCGSDFDTVLSLHDDCPGGTSNMRTCNDDDCSRSSRVALDLESGESVLIRVAGWQGATGNFAMEVTSVPGGGGVGPDAMMAELADLRQFGRIDDVVGCALEAPICNVGDEPVDWFAAPDSRHPMMIGNIYRLAGGRFQQLGQSWVKHGFGSGQENICGLGCVPYPDQTRLGPGCSDTYNASVNAVQTVLGPRSEVNPWTGAWQFEGSHFDLNGGDSHNALDHRIQLRDSEIHPAANPGALYFAESRIIAADDVDDTNNIGWERMLVIGQPGGTWIFDLTLQPGRALSPAIHAWTGSSRVTVPPAPTTDGRCILAWRVTDNGNGTWHYEYALYNLDMDRGVRALTIPVPVAALVSNIGFYAPPHHGEGISNTPWTSARLGGTLTFSTLTQQQNPLANALRWGLMYNFWFDATIAPGPSAVSLGHFKGGGPAAVAAQSVQVPGGASCAGDLDGSGTVNLADLASLLVHFGAVGLTPAQGDSDADGDVDLADLATLLARFGAGC